MAPGTTARTLPGINTASTLGLPHNGWLLRHGFGFLNVSYPGKKAMLAGTEIKVIAEVASPLHRP